jgi:hypothetical protein
MSENVIAAHVRDRKKQQAREQILDSFIALMSEGAGDLIGVALADRTGRGRGTDARSDPHPPARKDGALMRVRELAGVRVTSPESAEELLDTLEPIYTGFDAIAPIVTMLRTTPQGRQLRLVQNAERVRSYTAALADAVRDLPPGDRKLAIAMLQVLHTTPWLEMRDHWGLDGRQIARATGWAVRTLLADLERRGNLPLDRDPPSPAND